MNQEHCGGWGAEANYSLESVRAVSENTLTVKVVQTSSGLKVVAMMVYSPAFQVYQAGGNANSVPVRNGVCCAVLVVCLGGGREVNVLSRAFFHLGISAI